MKKQKQATCNKKQKLNSFHFKLSKKLFYSFQPFCFELFVAYLFFICHQGKNAVYFFSCLESTPSKQQQDFLRPRLVGGATSLVCAAQAEPELFKLSLTQARAFKVELKPSQPSNFFLSIKSSQYSVIEITAFHHLSTKAHFSKLIASFNETRLLSLEKAWPSLQTKARAVLPFWINNFELDL